MRLSKARCSFSKSEISFEEREAPIPRHALIRPFQLSLVKGMRRSKVREWVSVKRFWASGGMGMGRLCSPAPDH